MCHRGLARRRFLQGSLGLAGLGVLSGCGVLAPPAPPRRSTARIGVLTTVGIGSLPAGDALLDGLRSTGWVLGENLRIDYRFAQSPENVATTVAELAAMELDAVIAESNNHVKALKLAAASLPVVMALCSDPVRTGLITSLARPGGNVTGVASLSAELTEKRFDLLKQTLPGATRVTCVWIPEISGDAVDETAIQATGSKLGLQVQFIGIKSFPEVREAFAAAVRDGSDAIVRLTEYLSPGTAAFWGELVASSKVPVMSGNVDLARAGTLMAYGPKIPDLFRRTAVYVDRILNGVKPSDLPVEQPIAFDLAINLKTAQALRLTIPDPVVKQATELVQ